MFLAIEIGGSKLQLCVGPGDLPPASSGAERSSLIHQRVRHVIDPAAGADRIRNQLAEALPPLLEQNPVQGIGVGYGGPVDHRSGRVIKSHQVSGWDGFPLADWIHNLTGLTCVVENDSNAAAFGEAALGAGRGRSPVFYTNLGSGVGGGLVVDGTLYHGALPGEMEFGHLRLSAGGPTVEDRCSGWAINRRVIEAAGCARGSLLAALIEGGPSGGEARYLAQALAEGDHAAREILAEVGADFGFALSHVIHLVHPEVIVVGGGLSLLGEPLRAAIANALAAHVMMAFQPPPPVLLADLGEDAVPVGVLALIAQRFNQEERLTRPLAAGSSATLP